MMALPGYHAIMAITVRLLGRPQVSGEMIDLPAKAVALLGYLAYSDEPQARDKIMGLLWSESSEEAAHKNLRNTLWAVRRILGETAIVEYGDRLGLDPGLEADVRRLLAAHVPMGAQELLDLYGGSYLDGEKWVDAPEFELWLTASRERLLQVFLRRMTEALGDLAQAGAWRQVADYTRAALIRQFETLNSALAHDLGVEPSAATVALRDAIASGQLSASPAFRAPEVARRSRGPARPIAPTDPVFVGRHGERADLDDELASAMQGQARVILISGELGIGKSRLWREWAAGITVDSITL